MEKWKPLHRAISGVAPFYTALIMRKTGRQFFHGDLGHCDPVQRASTTVSAVPSHRLDAEDITSGVPFSGFLPHASPPHWKSCFYAVQVMHQFFPERCDRVQNSSATVFAASSHRLDTEDIAPGVLLFGGSVTRLC
jgi:hypothetical protein